MLFSGIPHKPNPPNNSVIPSVIFCMAASAFATTLFIGICTSLFSAILITRVMFEWMLERKMEIPFDNAMTRNAFKNINIDFVGKRKIYYAVSTLIIVLGVVFYFKNGGLNLGFVVSTIDDLTQNYY